MRDLFGLFKRKPDAKRTRIFYATDIHGSEVCFRKFCGALDFYRADYMILGGDMTGKMVVPIVRQGAGRFRSEFSGREAMLDGEDEVVRFTKQLKDMGFYPRVMSQDEFAAAAASKEEQTRIFHELIAERLYEWSEYAAKKLQGRDIKIYCAPGNDDDFFVDEILRESEIFELVEGQKVTLPDGREMITTGWANPTPWQTERECPEAELEEKLLALISQVTNLETAIFNIHPPPYNTKLDECPALDEEMRPISNMGQPVLKPVGSASVRKVLEQFQPLVGLHGHIHEGRGSFRLGRTTCINPGSDYSEGALRGCLLSLEPDRVVDLTFTTG